MKATEFGGADTDKTFGIQPAPHQLTPQEELRLMYRTEPATEDDFIDPTVVE